MKSQAETLSGPYGSQEFPPELCGELESPVRDSPVGEPMQPIDLCYEHLNQLLGRGQPFVGGEMGLLQE